MNTLVVDKKIANSLNYSNIIFQNTMEHFNEVYYVVNTNLVKIKHDVVMVKNSILGLEYLTIYNWRVTAPTIVEHKFYVGQMEEGPWDSHGHLFETLDIS